MRTLRRILLSLGLALTFAGAATAQSSHFPGNSLGTPDGIPPSQETVCDGQTGAAHGLCTAYCEAMDCDSGAPQASQKACDKVAANFLKITGQNPPCDCPCTGRVPDWIQALNGQFGLTACEELVIPGFLDFVALITGDNRAPGSETIPPDGFGFCGFAFGTGPFLTITPQQGVVCNALVRAKAAAAGLTCSGPV